LLRRSGRMSPLLILNDALFDRKKLSEVAFRRR
jgi:hypothetical protein